MSQQPNVDIDPEALRAAANRAHTDTLSALRRAMTSVEALETSGGSGSFGSSPAGIQLRQIMADAVATIGAIVDNVKTSTTNLTTGSVMAATTVTTMDEAAQQEFVTLAKSSDEAARQTSTTYLPPRAGDTPAAGSTPAPAGSGGASGTGPAPVGGAPVIDGGTVAP